MLVIFILNMAVPSYYSIKYLTKTHNWVEWTAPSVSLSHITVLHILYPLCKTLLLNLRFHSEVF